MILYQWVMGFSAVRINPVNQPVINLLNINKLFSIILAVLVFVIYDFLNAEPIEEIRVFNVVIEFSFSLLSAILFMSIDSLKGKSFYKYLSVGFFMVFVSMLVDGMDQFFWHSQLYTAIWEKITLLIGFIMLFIGVKEWIVDHELMNKKLKTQAYTDELTGLYNRRGMLKKISAMNELAIQNNQSLTLIIADLDDFKIYNDTMGHVAGDTFLADLGKSLYAMINKNAVIGRWGGEEFAICKLGVDLETAFEFAEQIRLAVASIPLPEAMHKDKMTLSLGVSQKLPEESFMDAIRRADRFLYIAKNKGKNQTVTG